jgi:hypothetical protein
MRVLALTLTLTLTTTATATPTEDPGAVIKARIAEGERRYIDQEYRACIEAFTTVLQDPASTRDQRARAYEYIGLSWLILGKKPRAREAFEDVLSIDPHYTLSDPSKSPKLREFFEEVRASFLPGYGHGAGEADLEHSAPTGAVAGRRVEIAALVTRGAALVKEVTLHSRRQGLLGFTSEPLRPDGARFRAGITPPRDTVDYVLEYYLEARDAKGRVVARVASPQRPLALRVSGAAAGPTPWYRRWYVWAAVGAVVAGAVVGGVVAGTAERAPDGTLPPGKVSLGLSF